MALKIVRRGTGITVKYEVYSSGGDGFEPEPPMNVRAERLMASAVEFLESSSTPKPYQEDSKEDYALRFLELCVQIIEAHEAGNIEICATAANKLGYLEAEFDLKEGWEKSALIGKGHRDRQSDRGSEGALKRWGNRDDLNRVLSSLAQRVDELGDPLAIKELWSEFYSLLDGKGLSPADSSGAEVKDSDRITWEESGAGISFKTFRNRIGDFRRSS